MVAGGIFAGGASRLSRNRINLAMFGDGKPPIDIPADDPFNLIFNPAFQKPGEEGQGGGPSGSHQKQVQQARDAYVKMMMEAEKARSNVRKFFESDRMAGRGMSSRGSGRS